VRRRSAFLRALAIPGPTARASDNFIDVKNLVFEPEFLRYVRDALSPVGLMLDFWQSSVVAGEKKKICVATINDLDADWNGSVRLRVLDGSEVLSEQAQPLAIPALGEAEVHFDCAMPTTPGRIYLGGGLDPSRRISRLQPARCRRGCATKDNLALARPATASSEASNELGFFPAQLAVDGKDDTRRSSQFGDDGRLAVDLGQSKTVSGVELAWEAAFAAEYVIETLTTASNGRKSPAT